MRRLLSFVSAVLVLAGAILTPAAGDDQAICYRSADEEGIAACTRVINSGKATAITYYNRAFANGSKGDFDAAIRDYDNSIGINPRDADAHYGRGAAYFMKGDFDRAIRNFDEVLRLQANYAAAYTNRGLAWERQGNRARAIADFKTALTQSKDTLDADWAHEKARERLAALE